MDRLAGKPEQPSLFDLSDITDNQFFEQAEVRVIEALRSYAEKAQNGQWLQRRLFMEDAVRGFAFVYLCQKRYDVVLMNPPFGDPPRSVLELLGTYYSTGKADLAASFVSRAITLTSCGEIGAITTRIPLYTIAYEEWRQSSLVRDGHLHIMADLGGDVLDTAMVEAAAYCISTMPQLPSLRTGFVATYDTREPEDRLRSMSNWCHRHLKTLAAIPGFPLAYWLPTELTPLFSRLDSFEPSHGVVRQGLGTTDDFRFCRLRFEVPEDTLCSYHDRNSSSRSVCWVPYVKGDSFSPYFEDYPLVVNWGHDGAEVKEFNRERYGSASRNVKSESHYGRVGLVFPRRTKRFCPRRYPDGMIFSVGGQSIFSNADAFATLGYMSTSLSSELIKSMLGRIDIDPQFEAGVVKRLPFPDLDKQQQSELRSHVERIVYAIVDVLRLDETTAYFTTPWVGDSPGSIAHASENISALVKKLSRLMLSEHQSIERIVASILGVSNEVVVNAQDGFSVERSDFREVGDVAETSRRISSHAVGVLFGRWNHKVRIVSNEKIPSNVPTDYPGLPPAQNSNSHGQEEGFDKSPLHTEVNGIVVDDPDHNDDVIRLLRAVIELVFSTAADATERELCSCLGVRELREYFRRPGKGGFWDDHISRYSKSRRKAPIYWLLQSSKKNYAIWLYYHRLDKDLLFKALVNYVEPKIRLEASRHESLRSRKAAAGEISKEAKRLAKEIEKQEDFISELRDFEDKLRRAANLNLEPDLNDGVVLNIAPLHELVPWKEAKKYWDELMEGQYEWSSIGKQLSQKGLVK